MSRSRAQSRRPSKDPPTSLAIPSESWLLWGLLYDLVLFPIHLVRLLVGTERKGAGGATAGLLRPFHRIACFFVSARMTAVLIALNLVVFFFEIGSRVGGLSDAAFLSRFALRPTDLGSGRLFATSTLVPLVLHVFAHAGWAHLLGNMLTLFVFGRVVEKHLGSWRLLSAYLGAAGISTVLSLSSQVVMGENVPTLGASGAVAGMVALGILFEPFTLTFEALVPMPLFLLGWLSIAADLGSVTKKDGIDHFAHLGGYLSVLFVLVLLEPEHRKRLRFGLVLNLLTAVLFALCFFFVVQPAVSSRFPAGSKMGERAIPSRAAR